MLDSLAVYLLAALLFSAISRGDEDEDEAPLFINAITSLLWPVEAIIVIWFALFGEPSDPDN